MHASIQLNKGEDNNFLGSEMQVTRINIEAQLGCEKLGFDQT